MAVEAALPSLLQLLHKSVGPFQTNQQLPNSPYNKGLPAADSSISNVGSTIAEGYITRSCLGKFRLVDGNHTGECGAFFGSSVPNMLAAKIPKVKGQHGGDEEFFVCFAGSYSLCP
jgi:hypothetical protein